MIGLGGGLQALAALLAFSHPPSPPPATPVAESFSSPSVAVTEFLGDATGVVAFGELHQTEKTAGVRSTLSRFTDEILPALAPRASHLIVETWVSRGACGATEKKVTADVARTTERPAETENEIVRLLRRAKELGVTPHVLDVDCKEYQSLVAPGGKIDYDRLLTLTGQHLGRAIAQALALPRPPERPVVLVYGGALHNDLDPAPALANYSFGPAIDALTHGDYREVDLYVPELVATLPALRSERWYPVWHRLQSEPGTTLLRRRPRSAIVVFEAQVTRHRKFEQWLGRETVALLEKPDRVEAFAVRHWSVYQPAATHPNPPPVRLPAGTPTDLGGYPVYAVGPPQSKAFARRLSALLFDDRAFSPSDPPFSLHKTLKGCLIAPGVGYRIWSGERSVDVLLCFECDQIEIGPIPGRRGWRSSAHGDIDDARAAFVALAKEALPDVPAIAAIPAERQR